MTKQLLHPLFESDTRRMAFHIFDVTGDSDAASRRIREMDALIAKVLDNPFSGTRMRDDLEGCIVRHGGREMKIRVVFEPLADEDAVFFLVASYGGENWQQIVRDRIGSSKNP